MSRFLKGMIVLLAIAAFAVPAMATDFSISGQARVEGYYNDQDSAPDTTSWFEQRVRLDNKFKVSDEVMVRVRFDLEDQWGKNGQYTLRNTPHDSMQTDYAYIQIDKEMFKLQAGEIFNGTANAILVDNLGTGFNLTLKTPVSVKLMYNKYNENGSTVDENTTDDQDFYGAQVGYKTDDFAVYGIYGLLDNKATDDNRSGYGLAANFNVANFALKAELDLLDGDNGAGTDYTGTQFYLDASTKVSEALNVGGFFWYVAGDETDTVIIDVTNWDDFNPLWGGYVGAGVVAASPITGWGPDSLFNAGPSEGLIAAGLNATFNVNDDLSFKGQGVYGVEEDDWDGGFDYYNLTASAKYKVATNTYFLVDAIYEDIDPGHSADDNSFGLWSQLQVNF